MLMEKVLGVYRITYPEYNVSQVKNLISHADYENIYKKWSERKQELELEISTLNRKKHGDRIKELSQEIKNIKTKLNNFFGSEFFTDESPLWLSRKCGGNMLLSPWQGNVIEVIIEEI